MEFLVFTARFLWLLQHKASVWDRWCLGILSNGIFLPNAPHDLRAQVTWKMLLWEESKQKQWSYCFSKMWWIFKVIMSMSYFNLNCDIPCPCISIIGNVEPLWRSWRYSILDVSFCFFWFSSYMINLLMPSFCHCQLFNKHLFRVYFKTVIW